MGARQSAAVDRALKDMGKPGAKLYRVATKRGVAPSTLYRAMKRVANCQARKDQLHPDSASSVLRARAAWIETTRGS